MRETEREKEREREREKERVATGRQRSKHIERAATEEIDRKIERGAERDKEGKGEVDRGRLRYKEIVAERHGERKRLQRDRERLRDRER